MSSYSEAAPSPIHLLRTHSSSVTALHISNDNERLYSGDASGQVVCTSTRSLRPLTSWKAHTDSLLGIEELGSQIITHGRDNKLHVWDRTEDDVSASVNLGGPALIDQREPTLRFSMDVNALNYCRFSLMPLLDGEASSSSASASPQALIALPNLVESSQADIWSFPSQERLHAGIGNQKKGSIFSDGRGRESPTGIIMSLHLFRATSTDSTSTPSSHGLRLLLAYESGTVALRQYTGSDDSYVPMDGKGWNLVWEVKLHKEAIMAMRVSRDDSLALTVSADHLVGRYQLAATTGSDESRFTAFRTKHPGNGSIAIRDDGRACAVGGWDGKIKLFSTKKLKPLGTLKYHKQNCNVLEFARSFSSGGAVSEGDDDDDDDGDMTEDELLRRSRWLVSGSEDSRVSIWELKIFEK